MNDEFILDLTQKQFTFGQVRAVAGVKADTFRNWLKRGVIDIGEKTPTGRMLFSGADAIYLKMIVKLVTKFSVSLDTAKTIGIECLKRVAEIVTEYSGPKIDKSNVDNYEPVYFLISEASEVIKIHRIESSDLRGHVLNLKFSDPNFLIPVDTFFWNTQTQLFNLAEYNQMEARRLEMFDPLGGLTAQELEKRYKEIFQDREGEDQ
ncbi:MAG: MerR family transcriptional regulator [Candidatus Thiodiazotropha sp.]